MIGASIIVAGQTVELRRDDLGEYSRVLWRAPGFAPYVLASVSAVHVHGCPSTRMGKKSGPCNCGAADALNAIMTGRLRPVRP